MGEQILEGVRIVDLSWGLAGPVATQILAEAGADVVKVERPGGDPIRTAQPAAFATWNRSKRSIMLDLHDMTDRAALDRLVESADVVVHGFTPAKAASLGLDDETLARRFPRLIICGITGYPPNHADAERSGWDLLVQARGGLMDFQAGWRDGPFVWRFPAPSWFAALLAAAGIAARLFHRQRTGRGGSAHTSLLQGVRLAENMVWCRLEDPPPSLVESPSPALRMPQVAMYQCADGRWIQILNPADRVDLSKLPLTIEALENLGLADVPFDGAIFAAAMTQFPSDAWLEAIRAVDVAVELLVPLGDLLSHHETAVNGFVVDVDDPAWGPCRQAGPPFKTDPPMRVRGPAPLLDEHRAEVAAEIVDASTVGRDSNGSDIPTSDTDPQRLLDGIRIVDFGAFLAGPLAAMLLADLGAEVIKIEPVTGDPMRGWRDEFFIACNRGKRDLALNIAHPEGKEVVRRLIRWADVVHHNIRPKPSERLGLDEAGIHAVNPNAVFSHSTSYGLLGPRADWPGYDSVFQAMSGWNIENAGEGNAPLFNHLGNLDTMNGTASALATLLALYHRERTGKATSTHASLLNTATFTNSETLLRTPDGTLAPYPRLNHDQTGLDHGYRMYDVADGSVAIVAVDEGRRGALRNVARVDTDEQVADALRERESAELLAALEAAEVPAERVLERQYAQVFDDDENRRTGVVVSYRQAEWGQMEQFGAYWHLGEAKLSLDRPCPAVGEHSREILEEIGFSHDEITRLADAGLVSGRALKPQQS